MSPDSSTTSRQRSLEPPLMQPQLSVWGGVNGCGYTGWVLGMVCDSLVLIDEIQ